MIDRPCSDTNGQPEQSVLFNTSKCLDKDISSSRSGLYPSIE